MENCLNPEDIEQSKSQLVGTIFTQIQYNILKKKLKKLALTNNEKTYYYKFIKPKVKAMMAFFGISKINIAGQEHFESTRAKDAIDIIKKLAKKKKIMISGSYLFNKNYRDIDIFIFSKYSKEDYRKGKLHISFLPESAQDSLFFASLSKISVSNFVYQKKITINLTLNDYLSTYEQLINSKLNNEEIDKLLRDFLLQSEYISKNVILNPKQLFLLKQKIARKNSDFFSDILINTLALAYDTSTIKKKLEKLILDYKELQKDYTKSDNLRIYVDAYSKVLVLGSKNSKG